VCGQVDHLNKLLEPVRVINDNLDFHSLDEVMEAVSILQQSEEIVIK
jgi:hypothetical protein